VPVRAPNSIANCYINGTGLADFTTDPGWDPRRWNDVVFHLRFSSHFPAQPGDSPLKPDDIVFPDSIMATVGFTHTDHDESSDWGVSLEGINVLKVPRGSTDLEIQIVGTYFQDGWIERIAYEIDMLIYRPELDQPASSIPPIQWKQSITEVLTYTLVRG
jgi:hypothetical protein